jgi:hypothetical protein
MNANQSFYSFAAVLLPTLLFGGVLVERLHPPKDTQGTWKRGVVVLLSATFALYAEVQAITASLVGNPSDSTKAVVVFAVIGATTAVALAIIDPWTTVVPRVVTVGIVVLLSVLVVTSVRPLRAGIEANNAREYIALSERNADEYERLVIKEERDEQISEAASRHYAELLTQNPAPKKPSLQSLRLEEARIDAEQDTRRAELDLEHTNYVEKRQKREEAELRP